MEISTAFENSSQCKSMEIHEYFLSISLSSCTLFIFMTQGAAEFILQAHQTFILLTLILSLLA